MLPWDRPAGCLVTWLRVNWVVLLETRVSNGTGQYNFSGQRDRSFFIVPRQRDNRTSSNLAKGRDGLGQLKSGMGRAGTAKILDGTRDKTRQSRKGCSKTGNGCSETGKDNLKQETNVLKQEIWSFSCFGTSVSCLLCSFGKVILSRDIPGHPGTEVFVPGHLLLPLSWDKGTPGPAL